MPNNILGAKFTPLTIVGSLVLLAIFILAVTKLISYGINNNNDPPVQAVTTEQILKINEERYAREDSIRERDNLISIEILKTIAKDKERKLDELSNFYNKTYLIYEKSIDSVNYANDSALFRQWAERYGR